MNYDENILNNFIQERENNLAIDYLKTYCFKQTEDYKAKLDLASLLCSISYKIDGKNYILEDEILDICDEVMLHSSKLKIKAMVLKCISEYLFDFISQEMLKMVNDIEKYLSINDEHYGDLIMIQALYYYCFGETEKARDILIKSIQISPYFSKNFELLKDLYPISSDLIENIPFSKKQLHKNMLNNVKKVIDDKIIIYKFDNNISMFLRGTLRYQNEYNKLSSI
ncbi:hypothetical protein BN3087_490023 [Sulfurovum sp. enrichment culture clone C5]|uniref:Uncharacterized protein n=1 Tax=Sulfurovum sp. enrichment culture clone C5 TaxID=497650 RepID=A0A0S4XNK8_9BACT|nr:hypothetical protein BN3087_490023 [Sulfurovum sp. enrichment culture clone C5]